MNSYPPNWPEISLAVKVKAGWRCVRCNHRSDSPLWLEDCDELCTHLPDGKQRVLTVHHLDGDKANCAWHNLAALCQVCHLHIQAVYHPDQLDFAFLDAERWLRPYVEARRA